MYVVHVPSTHMYAEILMLKSGGVDKMEEEE
jgi:hypothetical protein